MTEIDFWRKRLRSLRDDPSGWPGRPRGDELVRQISDAEARLQRAAKENGVSL